MPTRKHSHWKLLVFCICLAGLSNTLDFLYLTHASYKAKYAAANTNYLLGSTNHLSNMNGKITDIDRSTFDARCRRLCLQRYPPGLCKMAQTCWLGDNLTCELYRVNTCSQCQLAHLADETSGARYDCHIWEFNLPTDPEPTKACAEYVQGTFKGDCSHCGNKRGYDKINCSQPSTCAAKYYGSGWNSQPPSFYTTQINPCFTNGTAIAASCFGPFTRWYALAKSQGQWHDTTNILSYDAFLAGLPDQLKRMEHYCSTGKSFRTMFYTGNSGYAIYTGVTIGVNGSLSIDSYQEGNVTNTLQLPIMNAPLLQPVDPICGPMWLIEKNVFYNATHIDSCAMNHILLAPVGNKWGGKMYSLRVFTDIEIFNC